MSTITDYTVILNRGKKNATSSKDLCMMLGFKSVRELQKNIEQARRSGQLICSSTQGGYFLPEDRSELCEYVNTLERRGKGIMKTLHHARKALKKMEGQIYLKSQN